MSHWPTGDGEMARLIRVHDWASTPLGPAVAWPERLKIMVEQVLASPLVSSIVCGAERILIYNDAAARLYGDRHPAALGQPLPETFPEGWTTVATLYERVFAGEIVQVTGQPLDTRGEGKVGLDVFDAVLTPTRDEEGHVTGAHMIGFEVGARARTEVVLRESETRHRLLIGSWAQAVWETDASGAVMADSPSWRAYTGQTCEELLGNGWLDAIHPDDRAFAERQWREAVAACAPVDAEFRIQAPDGGWRWTNVRAAPVLDAAGRIQKWAGMNIDIGARKRAEAALRESEARFRGLVMAGRYLTYRMSRDWRQLYHLSGQGILADTVQPIEDWADLYLLPEDRPAIFEAIAQAIRTKSLFELEHRVRQADGGTGWVVSRAVPILDAGGEIEEWFGAGNDVTARRDAQERLREAEERYRKGLEAEVQERTAEFHTSRDLLQATMDASTDMIQVFEAIRDAQGRVVDFRWVLSNHTSESRYGKVEGESLLERNPGVLVEGIFDTFKRVTETGEPEQAEHHYVHEQFDGWFYQSVVKLGDGVATTTKEISEWKAAQAAILHLQDEVAQGRLRESEERLRQFGEASQDILWIRDAESLQWTYLTPAFEAIYGLSRKDALVGDNYRGWQDLIVPEDRARAVASVGRVRAGEQVTFEYRIRRPSDGQLRWLRDTDFPMRDDTGRVVRIGGIGHDVTTLKAIETALVHSEGRLRDLVEGVSQLVWRAVDGGDWIWASPQWTAFTGQAGVDSHGRGWLASIHPDDHPIALAAWARAEEMGGFEVEYRICNAATGAYRWFQTRAAPRRDVRGDIVEWLGTSTDVHQLKALQESQAVMVAELQHRTRNLIAVVRGIADDTMEQTGPTEAFRSAFSNRLTALSRVQGLLSRAEVEPITIAAVVRLELDALGARILGDRCVMAGPDVWLRNSTVQTLALALHELATNARKYGALSHERGKLTVTWSERSEKGERRLILEWVETGLERAANTVQPVSEGGGYGRELIERALPHALGARTSYTLGETGVRCTIDLPVRQDVQREGTS